MYATLSCPVCHARSWTTSTASSIVKAQNQLRDRFVYSRLRRRPARAELKDLTDFMHGFAAPLVSCARCGALLRAELKPRNPQSYKDDPNDPDLMAQLYPRYVQAFRDKAPHYKDLLRPRADVLELGSHLGGFLQTAEEWNWNPTGLDIGLDTSAFASSRGLTVRRQEIQDARIPRRGMDAVFIWNCFEQLPEPAAVLQALRPVLKPRGLLIVRVPNPRFYLHARRAVRALAWNNLLGFPYLHGYTDDQITQLVRPRGFEYAQGVNSELLTMPFPDMTSSLEAERQAVSARVARWSASQTQKTGHLAGPWIELTYRKTAYE